MAPCQQRVTPAMLSSLFPPAHNESQGNQPSDCGHHTFEKKQTSSFQPSDSCIKRKPAPPSDQQLRLSWSSCGRQTVHTSPQQAISEGQFQQSRHDPRGPAPLYDANAGLGLPSPVLRQFFRQFAVALVHAGLTSSAWIIIVFVFPRIDMFHDKSCLDSLTLCLRAQRALMTSIPVGPEGITKSTLEICTALAPVSIRMYFIWFGCTSRSNPIPEVPPRNALGGCWVNREATICGLYMRAPISRSSNRVRAQVHCTGPLDVDILIESQVEARQ